MKIISDKKYFNLISAKSSEEEKKKKAKFLPSSLYNYFSASMDGFFSWFSTSKTEKFGKTFTDFRDIYKQVAPVSQIIDNITEQAQQLNKGNNIDIATIIRNYLIFGFCLYNGKNLEKIPNLIEYNRLGGKVLHHISGDSSLNIAIGDYQCYPSPYIDISNSCLFGIIDNINGYVANNKIPMQLCDKILPYIFLSYANPPANSNIIIDEDFIKGFEANVLNNYGIKELQSNVFFSPRELLIKEVSVKSIEDYGIQATKIFHLEEIARPFNYPLLLLVNDQSTYNNLQTANEMLINNCVKPFVNSINNYFNLKFI